MKERFCKFRICWCGVSKEEASVLVGGWCDRQMKDWSTGNKFWWLLRSGCCNLLDATDLLAFPLTEQAKSKLLARSTVLLLLYISYFVSFFVLILVFPFFELNICKVNKYQNNKHLRFQILYGYMLFFFFRVPLDLWCKM